MSQRFDDAERRAPRPSESRQAVLMAGLLLVLAHTAFRAWAIYGAWFQEDDFEFLRDSSERALSLDYLMTPHTGHLMPLGRLLVDLSVANGVFNWPATAAATTLLQAGAGLSALWMLKTLFGLRWGIVPPLVLFLFSAITMPATVWWAVALNQIPQQIALMCAVACWVLAERTGRRRWTALTCACVFLALTADLRGLMIPPLLVGLSLGWFETGSLKQRLVSLARRRWAIGAAMGVLGLATVAYYAAYVPITRLGTDWGLLGPLTSTMLGKGFATGVIGGPWAWYSPGPPAAFASPPNWLTHLSWVVIAAVMAHAHLTRRGTGRAWALLFFGLSILLLLLWSSRAPYVGAIAGTEYRYLTEAAALAALALGLAYMEIEGAADGSVARDTPMFTPRIPVQVPMAMAMLLALSGVWSTYQYAHLWHGFRQPHDFVERLSQQFAETGPVELADTGLPSGVVVPLIWPDDRLPRMVKLLSPDSTFPDAAQDLAVVDSSGLLTNADLDVVRTSRSGPAADCGWKVRGGSMTIPLKGSVIDYNWWIRISYLAPQQSPVRVQLNATNSVEATLRPGPHQLFVKADTSFDAVRLTGIDPSITVCVDKVEVGIIGPGAPLT